MPRRPRLPPLPPRLAPVPARGDGVRNPDWNYEMRENHEKGDGRMERRTEVGPGGRSRLREKVAGGMMRCPQRACPAGAEVLWLTGVIRPTTRLERDERKLPSRTTGFSSVCVSTPSPRTFAPTGQARWGRMTRPARSTIPAGSVGKTAATGSGRGRTSPNPTAAMPGFPGQHQRPEGRTERHLVRNRPGLGDLCERHQFQPCGGVSVLAFEPGCAYRRIFDMRLAATLRQHHVTQFATRNARDFERFGFARVWDPFSGK